MTANDLVAAGWTFGSSFSKKTLILTKGSKVIVWNFETELVELEGELN